MLTQHGILNPHNKGDNMTHYCIVHSDAFGDWETTCDLETLGVSDGVVCVEVSYPAGDGGNQFLPTYVLTIGEKIK
tara:strand:- start:435 stop:662 length:228 start_codon:yes stop_codon:yes gene_type:complete